MNRQEVMDALAAGTTVFQRKDFSGADLRGLSFLRTHFSNCDFFGAVVTGAKFIDCFIAYCDLRVEHIADGEGVTFSQTILKHSNFEDTRLAKSTFRDCAVDGVTFGGSDLTGVTFPDSALVRVQLQKVPNGPLAKFDVNSTFKDCALTNVLPAWLLLHVDVQPAVAGPAKKTYSREDLKLLNSDITRRTCAQCGNTLRGCTGFTYCGVCEPD